MRYLGYCRTRAGANEAQRCRDSVIGGPPERETRGPRRLIYEPDDPGTRVTEREFLEAVNRFSR